MKYSITWTLIQEVNAEQIIPVCRGICWENMANSYIIQVASTDGNKLSRSSQCSIPLGPLASEGHVNPRFGRPEGQKAEVQLRSSAKKTLVPSELRKGKVKAYECMTLYDAGGCR